MKKSLLRAIGKKYVRLFIAMLLISSLGCGLTSGMASGTLSLQNTLDEYVEEMEYPDGTIATVVTTRDAIEKIAAVPGVEAVDARLVGSLVLYGKDGRYLSVQAMTYDPEEFQKMHFWEQTDAAGRDAVYLEVGFAGNNDLHVGDVVKLQMGENTRECVVGALVSRPELFGFQRVDGLEVVSGDVGYLYVPRELLKNIENPELTDAREQLDEKSKEITEKEKEAEKERDRAAKEIDDAEKELSEKYAELEGELKKAEEAREQLQRELDELKEKTTELEDGEKQLKEKQELLDQKKAELEAAKKLLEEQKATLEAKRKELDGLKASLEKQRSDLYGKLEEVRQKQKELASRKEQLLSAKALIEQELERLTGQKMSLEEAVEFLLELVGQQEKYEEILMRVKIYLMTAQILITGAQDMDPYEWATQAVEELSTMITGSELVTTALTQFREKVTELDEQLTAMEDLGLILGEITLMQQDVRETLASYGITDEQIFALISAAETYKPILQTYQHLLATALEEQAEPERIEELRQSLVAETQKLLDEYHLTLMITDVLIDSLLQRLSDEVTRLSQKITEAEGSLDEIISGMKQLVESRLSIEKMLGEILAGEKELADGEAQILDGIRQLDAALSSVRAGYDELEGYAAKVREGEEQLRSQEAEIESYQKQIDEGYAKLKDGRRQITEATKQIGEGMEQIDREVEGGKERYSEAKEQIEKSSAELDEQWTLALKEFSDIREELRKAREQLDEQKGYDEFCNQFLLKISPDADPKKVLAMAVEALGDVEVKNSYTYEDSEVKRVIEINVDPLWSASVYLPLFFFVVSLIVGFLFMSLLIRQCRREIGILRALGYSRGSITALFCVANAITMVGSVILGLLLNLWVTNYIGEYFRNFFHLHFYLNAFHWERFWISMALTFAVGQLATIVSARYLGSIQPSEAMLRPTPSKAFFSEGLGRLLGGIAPFVKYSIFSLLRNKLRFVFSVVCLSGSVMLIFMAFSFDASKNGILEDIFTDRILYDCEIYLRERPEKAWVDRLKSNGLVRDVEEVSYYSIKVTGRDATKLANVKVVPADTKLNGLYDVKHEKLTIPGDGIVLEEHFAKQIGAKAGETVYLEGTPLKVTALSYQTEYRFQFISPQTAEKLGEATLFSVICNVREEDENSLVESLAGDDNYMFASFTRKGYEELYRRLEALGICVFVVILFSIMIGLVIVLNTFRTNLQEQRNEICMLRALGHQHFELSLRLLIQAVPYFVFSCLLGFPLGVVGTRFVLEKLETRSRAYPYVSAPYLYLITAGVVFAYVVISHFLSMRAVRKWDVAETVRDKE